ncbi:DEAD/DEAH box helicase [Bordetella sp. N]|uniref:DEAD/DEAH box helicase n=1 Tax=Bordetella sp. N TaxID=1746199 RepID=UPI00070CF9D2|nr:DEAD/DEAH box helicase [Bordetella sp. N]ALM83382.1 ATP-dependent DNA helicase [Bordetella sp. N]
MASLPAQTDVLDELFHPAVADWFHRSYDAPTPAQQQAWPLIHARKPTLVAAPTGSGKTLTAFLAALDELVRMGLAADGELPDATLVLYVSPLKALSNDIRVNLQTPLAGISEELAARGLPVPAIRSAVRTGDTTQQERQAMRRRPPHILVTTPESLYVLLGSAGGRAMLRTVRSVIIDEIHAVAGAKRGSHLALSLARLDALCEQPPVRIGLSATQKPLEAVARFLAGRKADGTQGDCAVVDIGHGRARDLALEIPPVPLEAVMANDVWERVYDRMAELAASHRTTLVFVNTRRMAERTARHLAERLGNEAVAAHHGSLAKEARLDTEQRLKRGALKVLVATASLELGIDIGEVELVCQVGSPRAIAAFLQRVGRAGHQVGGISKGRLFPTSRDDLIECAALLDSVRRGELDTLHVPRAPLDVLAQQIVAEVANQEWDEDALYTLIRSAEPYAELPRARYDAVLKMLSAGYTGRNGVRGAYLHRDTVSGTVRGRRGSQLTAVTSGGTIPDNADYSVMLEPQGQHIGTVNEDFAVESLAGDVFQLGNTAYRILRIESGRVRVEDAHGMAPNIPFWLGEAPGRTGELSQAVGRLREQVDGWLKASPATTANEANEATAAEARPYDPSDPDAAQPALPNLDNAIANLSETTGIGTAAARQIVEYLARARAALGALPSQDVLILERFFDESGGMQLVLHAPFGSRINRAWGLALRKRFCRTFNFELQAAATEDAIVLSLSTSHSFPLEDVWRYLHAATARDVLVQALLDAPLFNARWRWNATTSLAIPRYSGGKKLAPQLLRMRSEDLLTAVFPDQAACLENIVGERELPDHPLVEQTLDDCLHEAMDCDGWLDVLRRIDQGQITLLARDLPAPSPLAMEILNANPYAFLDDAPLEERRTRAVQSRRWSDPAGNDDLGALDAAAIADVAAQAWPRVRSADEAHEALMTLGCVTAEEAAGLGHATSDDDGHARAEPYADADASSAASAASAASTDKADWRPWLTQLARSGRATQRVLPDGTRLWTALERLPCLVATYPDGINEPALTAPAEDWEREDAVVELLRARLSGCGPRTLKEIVAPLALSPATGTAALARLEQEGVLLRGRFTPGATEEEWCERHLLARIHRLTIAHLRREIEPVTLQEFMRFLCHWQRLAPATRGQGAAALGEVLDQLEGYEAAAGAWEQDLLPARVGDYQATWLDDLTRAGRLAWLRMPAAGRNAVATVRGTPIVLLPRRQLGTWQALAEPADPETLSPRARDTHDALRSEGAMFFDELLGATRLLPVELENALVELVAAGLVTADSYDGLRALLLPASRRAPASGRRRRGAPPPGLDQAGRWAVVRRAAPSAAAVGAGTGSIDGGGGLASASATSAPSAATPTASAATLNATTKAIARTRPQARDPAQLEHLIHVLLRRYGVLFWRLLDREADWLPPWRDFLPVLHRLEARGEIRGGRFVAGLAGEQFALPEAIPVLRSLRRQDGDEAWITVSAVDPLNLCGTLLPGEKIPALAGNRLLLRDGLPMAAWVSGELRELTPLTADERQAALSALARRG